MSGLRVMTEHEQLQTNYSGHTFFSSAKITQDPLEEVNGWGTEGFSRLEKKGWILFSGFATVGV